MNRSAIIVGQGLAGTVLSWVLESRGWKIHIIDDGHVQSSSVVAAGMWNPVSFRNLRLTWRFDEFSHTAEKIYREMEGGLGCRFRHTTELIRIFQGHGESNTWTERSADGVLRHYLSDDRDTFSEQMLKMPFGYGIVQQAGWLNLPMMLSAARIRWAQTGVTTEERFEPLAVEWLTNGVRYKSIQADHLILCTGWRNRELPWFGDLPVNPNKGELLHLQTESAGPQKIINFGNFLLPAGDGTYKLGASYQRSAENLNPTESVRATLLKNLGEVCPQEIFRITHHLTGFRPTVPDRKPLIGPHPSIPQLYCFNGFGSKGVILTPYFAVQLARHLGEGGEIDPEVALLRYWKH